MEPLVSIIVPVYNVEDYIAETLNSIRAQTYQNWECICVDDCSTDRSLEIVLSYAEKDKRIKVHRLKRNAGAAVARNIAIRMAGGEYLAFIDSDDLWKPEKLSRQIGFMLKKAYDFTCTSYGKVDGASRVLGKCCKCELDYTYEIMLKKCPGNSTVIYNCKKIGKVYGPAIRRRNDFAMWLKVMKRAKVLHGIPEVLGYHRVRDDSISIRKRKLLKYQFLVYYRIEKLGFLRSCYLTAYKVLQTVCGRNG